MTWSLLPALVGFSVMLWTLATQRERKRCSEIVRLRSVDHPVFDVRENGRNIRSDIWLGWDPKLYILPMPHTERTSQPSSPRQEKSKP